MTATASASEKAHMLCCASPSVVTAYAEVRLTPPGSRALPLALFAKPLQMNCFGHFLQEN